MFNLIFTKLLAFLNYALKSRIILRVERGPIFSYFLKINWTNNINMKHFFGQVFDK